MIEYIYKKYVANLPIKSATPSWKLGDAAGTATIRRKLMITYKIVAQKLKQSTESKVIKFCEERHTRETGGERYPFRSLFFTRGKDKMIE